MASNKIIAVVIEIVVRFEGCRVDRNGQAYSEQVGLRNR